MEQEVGFIKRQNNQMSNHFSMRSEIERNREKRFSVTYGFH